MADPKHPPRRRPATSTLAQVAVLFALCFPPLGLLLSLVALVRFRTRPSLRGRDLAVGGIVVSLIWGLIAAVTVPGFFKFQSKSRQGECRTQLRALHAARRGQPPTGGPGFDALDLEAPTGRERYAYYLSGGTGEEWPAPQVRLPPKVQAGAEVYAAALARAGLQRSAEARWVGCAGNIDSDDTLDVWVIRQKDGELVNLIDDLAD